MKHVVDPCYGFQVADEFVTLLPEMISRPANYNLSALYIDRYDDRSRLAFNQIMEKEFEEREYPGLCTSQIPSEFSES